jgi:hypothetical protein
MVHFHEHNKELGSPTFNGTSKEAYTSDVVYQNIKSRSLIRISTAHVAVLRCSVLATQTRPGRAIVARVVGDTKDSIGVSHIAGLFRLCDV